MDIVLQYSWVLLVLVALEGLLAADNAVVMAVMVKHLPHAQRKKALFYGLLGAFVLRFAALFMITLIVDWWFVQAIGAAYLLFICFKHLYDSRKKNNESDDIKAPKKKSGFWMTVVKVEAADLAFAIDSMLAAVALAVTLPAVGDMTIGGINGGQFAVMFAGGIIGLVIMRFAAQWFVKVLEKLPQLETAAFLIVGWVGVKLAVMTLAHKNVQILSEDFPHSTPWTIVFWLVLIGIAVIGYATAIRIQKKNTNN